MLKELLKADPVTGKTTELKLGSGVDAVVKQATSAKIERTAMPKGDVSMHFTGLGMQANMLDNMQISEVGTQPETVKTVM